MSKKRFFIGKPSIKQNPLRVSFPYALGDLKFVETLEFGKSANLELLKSPQFLHLLDISAFVLGVSYYKLLAPFEINAKDIALSEKEKTFILDVYENGLGEFFARNDLKRFGKIKINALTRSLETTKKTSLNKRILLPIGGGKDSLVSVQLLEKADLDFTPFAVNPKGPIISSVKEIGIAPIYVKRTLDPLMIELGKKPEFYNGHVPSTAINSMIASLVALLFDYNAIALSNERSASEGNVEFDGRNANHQHSKSLDFEKMIAQILSDITGGELKYFSLLRPFSELHIASIFTKETRFDSAFSSCNTNFKLSGNDGDLWCCNCPKCFFVFLILAKKMDKKRLINIFGKNLLDDKNNLKAYSELVGLTGHKPWECVGEILEAAACLFALTKQKDWQNDLLIVKLKDELLGFYGEKKLTQELSDLMKKSNEHLIPREIEKKVMAYV